MTDNSKTVSDVIAASGVKFGTGGARGLVPESTDEACVVFTLAYW